MKEIVLAMCSAAIVGCAGWAVGAFAEGAAVAPANAAVSTVAAGSAADQEALVERGRYLAGVADCIACHTAKGGKPFAGGLPIDSPIGKIYSMNITPDKGTGIGNYTLDDFDKAVRHGIAKSGSTLYPAMPYVSYAKVTPSDVKALYAYFMNGVQPVSQQNQAPDIPWPLSMRWPLSFWRMAFAPNAVVDDSPAPNDPILRGKYLVEGLAHCGACHTPRGIALQERSLTDDGKTFLSGGVIADYLAKSLRGDMNDGLGSWSEAEIVEFLKSGRTAHSAAFGGMAEVVGVSTQHMTDADLTAIVRYLKTLAPVSSGQKALAYVDSAAKALRAGSDHSNGALTFLDNCAACHRTTGNGYDATFPKLALSTTINTADPTSLIHLVLLGGEMPSTAAAPTHYGMPRFDARLTDRDIADVLTFVRASWGNHAPAVSADQVAKVRKAVGSAPQPKRAKNG
ncbi:cytochrome c [Paraburkholderia sp. IMGN_8]|uniref:cytochrome c n=1 Tax=Paraburkholderia sp. IMGN_8 TaxID=3136564 RepID=UPI0031014A4D